MPYCERFNIGTRKWETISQLNEPRYQALAFSVGECIYVAGGLIYDKNPRTNSIEKYEIKTNKWEEIRLKLPVNIESPTCVSKTFKDQSAEIYILGGRTSEGDQNTVYEIVIDDVEKPTSTWNIKNFSSMSDGRSNCKAFYD